MTDWIVVKFGGTSVTGHQNWSRIIQILSSHAAQGRKILMVCSAFSKVSDTLEKLVESAQSGQDASQICEEIIQFHHRQMVDLGVQPSIVQPYFEDLRRLTFGASSIQEVSPKLWARLLSAGEILSTKTAYEVIQQKSNLQSVWLDARKILQTDVLHNRLNYLSANADYAVDAQLQEYLNGLDASVVVTQGFIASNQQGETVLLGRGGSDTSAAYFASKIQAKRLEIWTDVPGLFTANPKQVPSARQLRSLDYAEAQELSTAGAKALHPRSIQPAKVSNIPIYVKSTFTPSLEGTCIEAVSQSRSGLKGITSKQGIALITMETMGMWQQVGFLGKVFAVFSNNDISIDMVSTSEASVTVSFDNSSHQLSGFDVKKLLTDLEAYCVPSFIYPVASVSLVGRNIRSCLHELAPMFERFADQRIHMLTQSASDLNLTVVVDEAQAEPLVRDLHGKVFGKDVVDPTFGPSWVEIFEPPVQIRRQPWWSHKKEKLLQMATQVSPTFVYDEFTILERANEMQSLGVDRVFFAIKANSNHVILRRLESQGVGFECVSPEEVKHVRSLFPDLDAARILFTPNFAPRSEYQQGFEMAGYVTLDSIFPLREWPEIFENQSVIVRIDTGKGKGHHKYVVTAGTQSKFGVPPQDLEDLIHLADKYSLKIVGLHAHAGSGIMDPTNWAEKAHYLMDLAHHFPHLELLNLGGGFGVPKKPDESRLDLEAVRRSIQEFRALYPEVELWVEPGRYLVAEAGVLLTQVTQLKSKGERVYVGCDVGMNSLVRPALYGAYHHIENLTALGEPLQIMADVVGPICESGDVLGRGRPLPQTQSGDVLVICNAGAYGRAMSSRYNLREPAKEVWIDS